MDRFARMVDYNAEDRPKKLLVKEIVLNKKPDYSMVQYRQPSLIQISSRILSREKFGTTSLFLLMLWILRSF
jgi:hypothetical protein